MKRLLVGYVNGTLAASKVPRSLSFCTMRDGRDDSIPHNGSITDSNTSDVLKKFVYPKVTIERKIRNSPYDTPDDSWVRVKKAFKYDYKVAKGFLRGKPATPVLSSVDILIIGGGIVGSSIAHAITERIHHACNILVVEKDPHTLSSSLGISCNGLYHQIPSSDLLKMSLHAADFYQSLSLTHDDPDIPSVDVEFLPCSSLQLVTENGAAFLEELSCLFNEFGWRHELLSPQSLKKRYPWLNVDDIALGCLGSHREGVFNPWKAVDAVKQRCIKHKVQFMRGEVAGFQFRDIGLLSYSDGESSSDLTPCTAVIQTPEGELCYENFGALIIAAGAETPHVLNMINYGKFGCNLPIETRKQFVHTIHCPNGPGINTPMLMDVSGVKLRRHGLLGDYLVWKDPNLDGEPSCANMNVDDQDFEEKVFPLLVNRVPALKAAQLKSSQAGLIDVNLWDENLLVGPVSSMSMVFVAAGFGNDELLFAPAVAKYIATFITAEETKTLDLDKFGLDRVENFEIVKKLKFS